MAGNFIVFRSFVYIPGALIRSSENNTNENTIYGGHNGAFNEITGHEHTGAPGDAPRLGPASINTAANYTWTGIHNFNNTTNLNFGGTINNYTITASTLITPTIADFTLAQHNHQNPAGGGTLDTAAIATGILPVLRGGTGVAVSTGTVAVVLSNTPTIITPVIADFTNAQHNHQSAAGGGTLDAAAIAAGILPVVRGGTGVATSTGTTNVVLSNSPTIVTPTIADFTNAQHNHQNAAGGGVLDINLATTGILGIGRGGTGAAVAPGVNQIIYSDGAAYVGNANFVWVNGTQRFGVGTGAPATDVHVSKAGVDVEVRVERTGGAGVASTTLIDGAGTTTIQSNGTNTYWQIARGNTYIRGDDALDCIEYATHSATPTFGTCRTYTGQLTCGSAVGGNLLAFSIADQTWLSCHLTFMMSWNSGGAGPNRAASYDFHFTVARNDAGGGKSMGVGGVGDCPLITNWVGAGPSAPNAGGLSVIVAPAPTSANYPRVPLVSGTGGLPQVLIGDPAGVQYMYVTLVDSGGSLCTIAFNPPGGGVVVNVTHRIVGKLETIVGEFL